MFVLISSRVNEPFRGHGVCMSCCLFRGRFFDELFINRLTVCFFPLQAKEKGEWLESRVRGAEQCESRLVQLHTAIQRIDVELCANLDQDLYGDELPELCQVRPLFRADFEVGSKFYSIPLANARFHRVLLVPTRCFCSLTSMGFSAFLGGFISFYWVLLDSLFFYCILVGLSEIY